MPFSDFNIDPTSGVVQISNVLFGLARPEPYTLGILAIDQGERPRSSIAELQVHIHEASSIDLDIQDIRIVNPPVGFQLNLTENMPAGYLIYKVEAFMGVLDESTETSALRYSLEVNSLLYTLYKLL